METAQVDTEEQPIVSDDIKLYDLDFLLEFPTISALDLDIIKLTAQFAAKNGKQFILHLAQKESRNPQFDFLKPHHSLHQFYQNLVKLYSLIFNPAESMMERVKRAAHQKQEQLKLISHRSRIEKLERDRVEQEHNLEEAEREAFAKINWHDFVIAEAVIFVPEDKDRDLSPPINVSALKTMPITQRLELWTGKKVELNPLAGNIPISEPSAAVGDEEEEMDMEEDMDLESPAVPVSLPTKRPSEVIMGAAFGGAAVKVRTDYVPRAATAAAAAATASASSARLKSEEPSQICSICKASVPVSQIDEHIRIELLDPKWRQQRMAMLAKNRDSNLLETGSEVSRNLEQLARHRGDIFDTTGSGAPSSSADTIERGPTRPIWDGKADSIPQINRAAQIMAKPQIEQEMAALQRSGDYSLDPSRGIGPRAPVQPAAPPKGAYHPRPPFMPPMIPGMPFPPPPPPGMPPFIPGMPFPPPPNMPPMPPGMPFPPPPGMPPFYPPPPFPPHAQPPSSSAQPPTQQDLQQPKQ